MACRIKKFAILFFMTFSFMVNAKYTIAIYTDQKDNKNANEYVELMQKTFPFNVYEIDYKIIGLEPKDLPCRVETDYKPGTAPSDPKTKVSESSVKCDQVALIKKTQEMHADQAMVIKTDTEFAGSGGDIAMITTATPVSALLHEFLHVLGFCDDYEYKAKDADIFCKDDGSVQNGVNAVIITPKDNYKGDSDARRLHWSAITWNKLIENRTPITNSNGSKLGTGDINKDLAPANNTNSFTILDDPIGLYKGKVCNNASKPIVVWHPGGKVSIMDNHTAGLGVAYEKLVMKILDSKGVKRKSNAPEKEDDDEVILVQPNKPAGKNQSYYGESNPPASDSSTKTYDQRNPFKVLGDLLKDAIYGNGSQSK